MRVFVLTTESTYVDEVTPVQCVHTSAESAMRCFNKKYFSDDYGVKFDELEGWLDAKAHNEVVRGGGYGPFNEKAIMQEREDLFIFGDEEDWVYIIGFDVED